jgi:hypothetical protein
VIPEFGKYVRSVRLIRGLRIIDVVRLLGITNPRNEAKPTRLLLELERTGQCPPQLFGRIAEALELDPQKLAELATAHEQNIDRVLDLHVTPTMVWQHRLAPTKFGLVWRQEQLPAGTTIPQALARASQLAKDNQVEVEVHVSRRQMVLVDMNGRIKRIERTRHSFAIEEVTVLGQRFHLRVRK